MLPEAYVYVNAYFEPYPVIDEIIVNEGDTGNYTYESPKVIVPGKDIAIVEFIFSLSNLDLPVTFSVIDD